MPQRIGIITIGVQDLEQSRRFYQDAFVWRPWWPAEPSTPATDHVAFELQDGLSFVLYPRHQLNSEAELSPDATGSGVVVTYYATTSDEVGEILSRGAELGGRVLGSPSQEPWGYTGRLKDPDGHLWEIMWRSSSANGK